MAQGMMAEIAMYIRYDIDDSSIWGSTDPLTEGYDPVASQEKLVTRTEQAIREAYPDADVDFETTRGQSAVDVQTDDINDELAIQSHVQQIIHDVWVDCDWVVEQSHPAND